MKNITLKPVSAIVFYSKRKDKSPMYIEKGEFELNENKEYSLQGLTPLMDDEYDHIIKSLVKSEKPRLVLKSVIPKNILYYDLTPKNEKVIWLAPGKTRKILFSATDISGEYAIPNVLFYQKKNTLYVFLIKSKDVRNISEKTRIYHTHFYNVHPMADICIGNGYKLGENNQLSLSDFMKKAEENFFSLSVFTHPHYNGEQKEKIWKEGKGIYPEEQWNQFKSKTIKDLL